MSRLIVLLFVLLPNLLVSQGLILKPTGTQIQSTTGSIFSVKSNSDFEFIIDNNDNPGLTAFFEVFNGAGTHAFLVNENGVGHFPKSLGINTFATANQALALDGRATVSHDISALGIGNYALSINDPTKNSPFNAIQLAYANDEDSGYALFAETAGGLNVGEPNGFGFQEVNASAFNVSSDKRVKKDIRQIDPRSNTEYMEYIRNIESVRFRYNHETEKDRQVPHIGVIAQSLPDALVSKGTEHPNGTGEEILTVSLADWLGLLTVGVKSTDNSQQELEAENDRLRQTVESLEEKLARMEAFLQKELDYTLQEETTSALSTDASLGQNQPNPGGQETIVPVKIPEGTQSARLILYDSQGRQLKSVAITDRGAQRVSLSLVGLPAGTYSYALLVNGQRVATKQLIRQ